MQRLFYRINKIPGLYVMGKPLCCIIAFNTKKFHIYSLADKMREMGWLLGQIQYPSR